MRAGTGPADRSLAPVLVLSASGLAKAYDQNVLFTDVSFGVSTNDHIGVVGRNGAGKSTLLRILAGDEEPDAGEVVARSGVRIAWLPQEPRPPARATAIEVARDGQEAFVPAHEAEAMLDVLGILPDHPVGELSGGQRRRVALAKALLAPSDLLILDEPTNHLDVDTIDWLEEQLRHRAGGLMMVTHDRYFLERLTDQMLEVDGGGVFRHEGSYADMLEARAHRQAVAQKQDARRRNLLRKEIEWLRRQPKARGTKPKFREDTARELMNVTGPQEEQSLQLGTGRRRLGTHVIDAEGLTAGYEGVPVVAGVEVSIGPGDRIGIAGPNGAGKTTLLKTLIGELEPVAGEVKRGSTVELGVYRQDADVPADDTPVLETILEIGTHIPLANGDKLTAGRLAERFGFDDRLQYTPVRRLSGGERRRLALLHILVQAPNVLVLDEPTNDLDLDTLAALEDHLDGFRGTLIVASHDRFVLDRLTDELLAVHPGRPGVGGGADQPGHVTRHLDWRHYRDEVDKSAAKRQANATPSAKSASPAASPSTLDNKRRQQLMREARSLEGKMETVDKKITALDEQFAAAATDPAKLQELGTERSRLQDELADLEAAWLAASEELEAAT